MLRRQRRPFAGDAAIVSDRVAQIVARHSTADENPTACLRGRWDQSLIVFEDRVLIVKPRLLIRGRLGAKVTTLYLRDVSGIHVTARMLTGWIEVTTAAFPRARRQDADRPPYRLPNCVPIRRRRLPLYEPVLAELRIRISATMAAAASTRAEPPEQILSELERLGALRLAGILSHDEFERAKRLLLDTREAA